MRVINRILTAESGPRSPRVDGPKPVAGASQVPEPTADQVASAPIITSENRAPQGRRRSLRVALIVELAVLLVLASASAAHADTMVVALADSLTTVLNNIRNWIMGILAGLATVFLTVGGVRYVMGSGEPGEVEKAKSAFKSAGWGYGLAALAPLIVEILKGIVGA